MILLRYRTKLINLYKAKHLVSKFKEARRTYLQQKAVHEDLAVDLPQDKVSEWEATPLDPVRGRNKKWSSPLMDPVWNGI